MPDQPLTMPGETNERSEPASGEVSADRHELASRLTGVYWVAVACLGSAACWIDRNYTNTDGISYVDVASAFIRHDWRMAINAYWSPLYPFLLSIGLRIFHPSAYKEFAVVHLVNFAIFLGAAGAFRFFARRLLDYRRRTVSRKDAQTPGMMPEWALLVLGYTLFLWCSLTLITLSDVSPDMLVSVFVYLAAGIVLGMPQSGAGAFGLLGLMLGLGYLAKAPMLPMSIVFLAMAVVARGAFRKSAARLVPAVALFVVAFAIVAGPFVAALSHFQGRLTWGDSAKLNYAWYVDHVPRYHWQGEGRGVGAPAHPTTKLHPSPAVYAFESPGKATYSVWFDPAYWNAGARPRFDAKANLSQILTNSGVYADVLFREEAAVLVVCGMLFLLGGRGRFALDDVADYAILLAPVAAAFAMYALVHVETRMIGAYVAILWMALFAAIRTRESTVARRAACCGSVAVAVFTLAVMASSLFAETVTHGRAQLTAWNDANALPQWRVVNELHKAGIQPGDRVAWIRPNLLDSDLQNYSWAQLARVQIVAEVPGGDADAFWALNPAERSEVMEVFKRTRAVAVIATRAPGGFSDPGWNRLGGSGYFVYLIDTRTSTSR